MDNQVMIEKMAKLYKILGEKNRLGIVVSLQREGKMCVHELCCALDASQSLISHQLRILREAQIVSTSKRGNEVVYTLKDDHITNLINLAKEHIEE